MRRLDFDRVRSRLLPEVELIVVAEHRALHRDVLGETWSRPSAYRWIRYEHPDPIGQLIAATRRLAGCWSAAAAAPGSAHIRDRFTAEALDHLSRALEIARELGYGDG